MVETCCCYPTREQHERWRKRANDLGMTKSDFVASMVEAGIKASEGFDPGVMDDETIPEVRQQRNELREELERSRARVSDLEQRAYGWERREAERFVRENPGCSHSALINHLQSTVLDRMDRVTESLLADKTPDGGEGWYLPENQGESSTSGSEPYITEFGLAVEGER